MSEEKNNTENTPSEPRAEAFPPLESKGMVFPPRFPQDTSYESYLAKQRADKLEQKFDKSITPKTNFPTGFEEATPYSDYEKKEHPTPYEETPKVPKPRVLPNLDDPQLKGIKTLFPQGLAFLRNPPYYCAQCGKPLYNNHMYYIMRERGEKDFLARIPIKEDEWGCFNSKCKGYKKLLRDSEVRFIKVEDVVDKIDAKIDILFDLLKKHGLV